MQLSKCTLLCKSKNFEKARQLLVPIESQTILPPDFKAQVNNLLARCYSRLGEPGMQQEAYLRALSANPQDITAKLGLITHGQPGEIEGAIKEYRTLVKLVPRVNFTLAGYSSRGTDSGRCSSVTGARSMK